MKIITIDGPSGVGKGTLAIHLVERLHLNYLNSGSIYRSIAYIADTCSMDLDNISKLIEISKMIAFRMDKTLGDINIIYKNKIINQHIYNEKTAKTASKIASNQKLRDSLVSIQRSFAKQPGLVAEGRDMGSAIFPNADIKFFLTANNKTRAERRFKQLKEKGFNVSLTQLIDELDARDHRDLTRKASPLIIPEDAIVIKTDNKSIDAVQQEVINLIEKRKI